MMTVKRIIENDENENGKGKEKGLMMGEMEEGELDEKMMR